MQLAKMSLPELIQMWRNCQAVLSDPSCESQYPAALARKAEILAEWQHRSERMEGYFRWPATKTERGVQGINTGTWYEHGLLAAVGYHVGANAVPLRLRQRILREVFEDELPPVNSPAYMAQWGRSGTPARLEKLANTIASMARHEQNRMDRSLDRAVRDREADLQFLYDEFYVGRFHFAWPGGAAWTVEPTADQATKL